MAKGKKNAARRRAWIVYIDESGLPTSPLVRRAWAPKGQTPILVQRGNTRQKASVVAALAISPRRRKVRLVFSLRPHENVNAEWMIAFPRDLRRHLGPRMTVIWDNLNVHRARVLKTVLARMSKVKVVFLPPYTPELNSVEAVWAYLKMNPLANYAPNGIEKLATTATDHLYGIQKQQQLLRAFIKSTPLSIRLR